MLAIWLIALIGFFAISQLTGSAYSNSNSLSGTDSAKAQQVLTANFPAQAGDSDQIVVQAKHGTLRSPAAETAVTSMLARVARLPGVSSVTSLYGQGGQISRDGTIGFATVNLDDQATTVPNSVVTTLISTAQSADSSLLNVQLGGAAIEAIVTTNADYTSALLGIVLALVVLFFAFRRSVYGALLPLISALVAIGVGTSIVNVLTHALSIANWVPDVAVIVALGVGVDYALFVVSRHRNGLLAGQSARGRRRHRAQHLRPRRVAGRADRMRRAAGAARPAGPLPARGGRDNLARGRPDHGGVADPAAGHAGLPRPEGAAREPSATGSPRTGARSSRQEPSGCAGPKGSAAGR